MKKLVQALTKLRIRAYRRFTPFITTYPGFRCFVTDKSSLFSMYDEIFKRELYRFESKNPAPRILDCGANIGLAAVYWKRLFPAARITCFEPDPKTFEALTYNVKSAGLTDVACIPKGLGAKVETRQFFSEGADGGRVAVSEDTHDLITVDLTTLSPYLTEPIEFLKIDIEGSEYAVLEECKGALGNVERVFVEYHSLHDAPQDLARILEILSAAGFRYYIEGTGVNSEHPFVAIRTHLGYDNQLNIFGYRTSKAV